MKNNLLKQIVLCSKQTLKYFLLQLLVIQVVVAESTSSQSMEEYQVTLNINNQKLVDVLAILEKQTDFVFAYNQQVAKDKSRISMSNTADLKTILKKITEYVDFDFKRVNNNIYVTHINSRLNIQEVIEFEEDVISPKYDVQVSGTVKDENDDPLPGASVTVAGTTIGTVTDIDGNYTLNVDEGATLIFSYIGFKTQKEIVGNRSKINITLLADFSSLDEVVVVGYGTQKKSNLTGSVESVSRDDFNKGVITNVDEALIGKVSGVEISQVSGEPGAGLSIRIRGAGSINAGNEPLYVIDGLPINNSATINQGGGGSGAFPIDATNNTKNPLNTLDPNNIQSIEILKDASATAIYGARGSNGVVLITTKRGIEGKARVDYSYDFSHQTLEKRFDMLGAQEYMRTINALSADMGEDIVFSESDFQTIPDRNYNDLIFRNAITQTHNLTISGGTKDVRYSISGNLFDQEGLVIESGLQRYGLQSNIDTKISDSFEASLSLNISHVNDQTPAVSGSSTANNASVIAAAIGYDPTLPLRNEDGSYYNSSDLLLPNPISVAEGITNDLNTKRVMGNLNLKYTMTDNIFHNFRVGMDQQSVTRDSFISTDTFLGSLRGGIGRLENLDRQNTLLEYTFNYNNEIFNNVNLNAVAGTTYEEFNSKNFFAYAETFPSDVVGTDNLGLGDPETARVGSYVDQWRLLSYFGRINLNLYDKFLFTGTIRADGSSRFGENNRFGFFPSAAIAYKLDEEDFIPEFFEQLKIRASYGLVGNQEIPNYLAIATYSNMVSGTYGGAEQSATGPSRLANPDLKWEESEQLNIGLDLSIWQNRVEASFDYYIKNTNDMLLFLPVPLSVGFNGQFRNIGSMRNSGFEAQLVTRNIQTRNFQWVTRLNFSTLKNVVTDLGDRDEIIFGETIIRKGEPLHSYFGYRITGIFQNEEEISNSAQPNSKPGYPIYEDVNGDGVINQEDRVIMGKPFADFQFGVGNNFTYKNFNMSIFFQGKVGHDLYNRTAQKWLYAQTFRRNRNIEHVRDRWTPDNPNAKWPSLINPALYGPSEITSMFVEDASFIRLRSLSFGYDIPIENNKLLRMATVNLTASNLFTLTNYSGVNPEASNSAEGNARVDYASYPMARTVTLGFRVSF